ncbi:MAG: N-acetyltransferase [bacterium]
MTNNFAQQIELEIHPWTVSDLSAVRTIALATWLATYGSFIPEADIRKFWEESYTIEKLTELCNSPTARGFIESHAAGFAKTRFNSDEKKFYLQSLYVLPEHQGKGIGSKLLDAVEEYARTFDVDSIWLGVMSQNLAALDWYRRIGFQFEQEEPFTMGTTTVMHLIGFRTIKRKAL